ncbi:MAG: bifunctional riboflavin kinase/FAD synthetase [Acidibacillus sp.]|nr:bifunctional riboflavin kinase/FAD synthetase [Acidibacillus sp.]
MNKPLLIQLSEPPVVAQTEERVFAIGKFDGIHIAHQTVIRRAVDIAILLQVSAAIFTFDPHPRYALTGDKRFAQLLTPLHERAEVAATLGMVTTVVATFDRPFQGQTAREFVCQYLLPLGARHLVVGYDFRFGKNGRYTPEDLLNIGKEFGLGVDIVQPIDFDGIPVSSSMIREELDAGDLAQVTALLGRPYRLRGIVVKGDQRGRTIGFPTANLALSENYVLPKLGVYVVDVWITGVQKRAVMNIGKRPTVYDAGAVTIEVHILAFDDDLYDQQIVVDVLHYVRGEQKFAGLQELQGQLREDAQVARAWHPTLS